MTKLVNPNMFNAVKHGVSSRHGLLPWENPDDYASLEAQWRRELRPHGAILENLFAAIVRNRWLRQRNDQAMAIFAACHPFGRAVAENSQGSWLETARKFLSGLDAALKKLEQLAESLRKQAAATQNTADRKRLIKAADKYSDTAQSIAANHERVMSFFVGLGEEIRKQSDREVELDGKFNKQLTNYFQVEQMLATRVKLLPHLSHQSSADNPGGVDEALHEKSEPKGALPMSEKKGLADPADDVSDDDDWDIEPKH
jgi:hypothetical protein